MEKDEVRENTKEQDLHKPMGPGEVLNVSSVNEIRLLFLNSEVHPQKEIKFCFLLSNI